MADVVEVWADTGIVVERDFTQEEAAQHAAGAVAGAEHLAERESAVSAAIAHARSLGFTDEMIAVMYPNLASEPVA